MKPSMASRRCHDHGNDAAHGGGEVRQSAAHLGIRSWHGERGEPGRDPPTRRTLSVGHPAKSAETVGSGSVRARLETSTAGSGGENGSHSAWGGNLHSVPYGGSHGESLKSPAENDRARSIKLKDRNKMERRLGKIQARLFSVNDLYEVGLRDTA